MVVVLFGTKLRSDADLDEVSIARFETEDASDAWRLQREHVETQERARESFYESYWVQVCTTVRDYEFSRAGGRVVRQDLSLTR